MTDEGVCALARAIEDSCLPVLSEFYARGLTPVTSVGVMALTSSLIKNCPRLTHLDLSDREHETELDAAMVKGMVHFSGCRHRLQFQVLTTDDWFWYPGEDSDEDNWERGDEKEEEEEEVQEEQGQELEEGHNEKEEEEQHNQGQNDAEEGEG